MFFQYILRCRRPRFSLKTEVTMTPFVAYEISQMLNNTRLSSCSIKSLQIFVFADLLICKMTVSSRTNDVPPKSLLVEPPSARRDNVSLWYNWKQHSHSGKILRIINPIGSGNLDNTNINIKNRSLLHNLTSATGLKKIQRCEKPYRLKPTLNV